MGGNAVKKIESSLFRAGKKTESTKSGHWLSCVYVVLVVAMFLLVCSESMAMANSTPCHEVLIQTGIDRLISTLQQF